MKLLVITSVVEDMTAVSTIMEDSGIAVYSVSETTGRKTKQISLQDNWFGKNENGTKALFFFSFTAENNADAAIQLVNKYNLETQTGFPIRAFVFSVESSSN